MPGKPQQYYHVYPLTSSLGMVYASKLLEIMLSTKDWLRHQAYVAKSKRLHIFPANAANHADQALYWRDLLVEEAGIEPALRRLI